MGKTEMYTNNYNVWQVLIQDQALWEPLEEVTTSAQMLGRHKRGVFWPELWKMTQILPHGGDKHGHFRHRNLQEERQGTRRMFEELWVSNVAEAESSVWVGGANERGLVEWVSLERGLRAVLTGLNGKRSQGRYFKNTFHNENLSLQKVHCWYLC